MKLCYKKIGIVAFIITLAATVVGFGLDSRVAYSQGDPVPVRSQENGKMPFSVADDGAKVFELVAEPVQQSFTSDFNSKRPITVWGYNGKMPGPTIEVTEGDLVRVNFKNNLPEPTTVHWHGLELPNAMDGASGHTQPPIPPGGTFVYEFRVKQNGTFMYHSGHNQGYQVGMGLGGFFIAHPKTDYAPKVDVDYTMMLQMWKVAPGGAEPDTTAMEGDYFTINGKSAPSTLPLEVKLGQRVRIRIANLSMMSHPVHLHGHTFMVTGTDGGRIPDSAQWPAATVSVGGGETRTIEFVANAPGTWMLHCHFLHHIMNDMNRPPIPGMGHNMGAAGGMHTTVDVEADDGGWN